MVCRCVSAAVAQHLCQDACANTPASRRWTAHQREVIFLRLQLLQLPLQCPALLQFCASPLRWATAAHVMA